MRPALLPLCLLMTLIGGCYRLAAPPQLPTDLAIVVVDQQGRLVRSSAMLQQATARSLRNQLGWSISPSGKATLKLSLAEEYITDVASGQLQIPNRWQIGLRGTYELLVPGYERMQGSFAGDAYTGNRDGEIQALGEAARSAADSLAATLEAQTRQSFQNPD